MLEEPLNAPERKQEFVVKKKRKNSVQAGVKLGRMKKSIDARSESICLKFWCPK